ncbi:MAG: DUF4388 domain-containing protein [Acidobacteriota bacterium]
MSLRGNLNTMPLPDVMQWLAQGRKTGILHVRSADGIGKKVYFKQGDVLSTASSSPREYLGQFLISRGYISEEQLNRAIETQLETGIKLGRILVRVGIMEEEPLKKMLQLKAEESLFDLFLWDEGEFVFEEKEEIEGDLVPVSLDVMSLVMEGIRRKDEWARIREVFPTDNVVLKALEGGAGHPGKLDSADLTRVLAAVDGRRSLADMAMELHATPFFVASHAFALYEKKLVETAGEHRPPEEVQYDNISGQILAQAERFLAAERLDDAVNLLKYRLKKTPDDKKARALLARTEKLMNERFFEDVVQPGTVLTLKVPLEKLSSYDLTPQQGYIATRVNGIWDIASILKVCPMSQDEAHTAIRKLLEMGVLAVLSDK